MVASFADGDENAVIFSAITGQSHLVDSAVIDFLDVLPSNVFMSEQAILDACGEDTKDEQKVLLTHYITDIINNLLAHEIISCSE
ncbi:hypothetical protein DXX94_12505 [Thalassotalea euphylliae]|uniref:HPr-rel-A system PqqD family peptide chaperone n=2 Tax=Thalassotalea euphylliae TaxID=1655234 RepID=A0A3E0U3F6_9GAMM|nr:hypothetical protein DXX94_12505 [Thalassotalea euphylliae]